MESFNHKLNLYIDSWMGPRGKSLGEDQPELWHVHNIMWFEVSAKNETQGEANSDITAP